MLVYLMSSSKRGSCPGLLPIPMIMLPINILTFVSISFGLTHWGRVTHICVGKLTIIALDNGLSPERRQAIIWTNAGILVIGPLGTNFSEIWIEIQTFSLKKIRLKMSSAKCCSFRLGLNVLKDWYQTAREHRALTMCIILSTHCKCDCATKYWLCNG